MSRNGSGTYSVVNTFVSGTTITAADHNENWSDLASEMTNSVAADGQTSMTGALKASNGTVAAPAVTFASDTDTGMYRIGANNVGFAVNGTKIVDVATTGATIVGDLDATTVKQGGFALLPVGAMIDYAGTSAPSGWLLCYGQAISRTTYSALFTAIGTTFGSGDGSTTFNLPDLRNRIGIGKGDMGGSSSGRITTTHFGGSDPNGLGATGGDDGTAIAQANLPNVSLSAASLTVSGTNTNNGQISYHSANASVAGGGTFTDVMRGGSTANITWAGTVGGSVPLGGSGTEISRIPPAIIVTKIIYAGV